MMENRRGGNSTESGQRATVECESTFCGDTTHAIIAHLCYRPTQPLQINIRFPELPRTQTVIPPPPQNLKKLAPPEIDNNEIIL